MVDNRDATDMFDTVETSVSGQLDSTFIARDMPESELDGAFDESEAQSHLLASMSVTGYRGE